MNRRWEPVVFALIMSVVMSLAIAFFPPLISGVPGQDFVALWMGGTAVGFAISFPVSLVAVPVVRRVVGLLME